MSQPRWFVYLDRHPPTYISHPVTLGRNYDFVIISDLHSIIFQKYPVDSLIPTLNGSVLIVYILYIFNAPCHITQHPRQAALDILVGCCVSLATDMDRASCSFLATTTGQALSSYMARTANIKSSYFFLVAIHVRLQRVGTRDYYLTSSPAPPHLIVNLTNVRVRPHCLSTATVSAAAALPQVFTFERAGNCSFPRCVLCLCRNA